MLVAAQFSGVGDFEVRSTSNGPPRIISEVRKRDVLFATPHVRPKLSGDLLVRRGLDLRWWPRRVTVLGGQLHVAGGRACEAPLRLPLRHLSLQAGPLPNSLALCRGHAVLITLQTASERQFDLWVKTIAIELIRQTPLYDVKYLDILTLAECWKRKDEPCEKDWNFNTISCQACSGPLQNKKANTYNNNNNNHEQMYQEKICNVSVSSTLYNAKPAVTINNSRKGTRGSSDDDDRKKDRSYDTDIDDDTDTIDSPIIAPVNVLVSVPNPTPNRPADLLDVEDLKRKCQSTDRYVPVKQKLALFESLSRLGRKVRSTEDVSCKVETGAKRARSLHDLSHIQTQVREICKYFEGKSEEPGKKDCDSSPLGSIQRLVDRNRFYNSVT